MLLISCIFYFFIFLYPKIVFPVLKRRPANINLTAFIGLTYTLNCPVYSVPPANVTWFYGNVSLSEISNDNRRVYCKGCKHTHAHTQPLGRGKVDVVNTWCCRTHTHTRTPIHPDGKKLPTSKQRTLIHIHFFVSCTKVANEYACLMLYFLFLFLFCI